MPRTCTICDRPDRDEIEHAAVSGGSLRDIAGRYGVAKSSLSRHLASHLPAATVLETQNADSDRAAGLRERLEDLYVRAERILAEAEGHRPPQREPRQHPRAARDTRVRQQARRPARGPVAGGSSHLPRRTRDTTP
jgi:hypothetical protein